MHLGLIMDASCSQSQATAGNLKMFKDNTNLDVESTDHEQHAQNELDPLIQRDVKVPSKQEADVARSQFLAMCWTMFLLGWTNSSTGPLLLRIQSFYDVSSLSWPTHYFFNYFFRHLYSSGRVWNSVLDICFTAYGQWCLWHWNAVAISLHDDIQGIVVGALLNMPMSDRLGLGRVSS